MKQARVHSERTLLGKSFFGFVNNLVHHTARNQRKKGAANKENDPASARSSNCSSSR